MKKENKENEEQGNVGIYYDALDSYIPEDKLGENVLYFPSSKETINVSNRVNPFTNVVRDNIELNNLFTCYDVKSTFKISTDILNTVASYMANSIMMNAITIFEDPWNDGSLINILKGFLRRDDEGYFFSQQFYTSYNNFVMSSNDAVYGIISDIARDYFYNYTNGITSVNSDYVVPFINDLVKRVSKAYADNGQRFIADIVTNGSMNNELFNSYLISLLEKDKPFNPDLRTKMVSDNAHAITYLNITLNAGILKLSQISEAIAYSGLYYIKNAIRNIEWEKCSNRKDTKKLADNIYN